MSPPPDDTAADADDIVRRYLHALVDPRALIDTKRMQAIEDALASPDTDNMKRLDLLLERRRLQQGDIGELEAAFIRAAPRYLQQRGVEPVEARDDLLAVGVPEGVVERVSLGHVRPYTGGVPLDHVIKTIMNTKDTMTVPGLMDATGASRGTVTKAVKGMLEDGVLTKRNGRPITYTHADPA
jgi:hypothetical protein